MNALWQRFREEHPDVPAKQIEDLWRKYSAENGEPTEAPKKRGRPPGSKNRTATPAVPAEPSAS